MSKKKLILHYTFLPDENLLPDGTFAISLQPETQEEFEVVKDWDLSGLEPQKLISLEKLKKHIKDHGEKSDFHVVEAHVQVRMSTKIEKDVELHKNIT